VTEDEVLSYVRGRLPDFVPIGAPRSLPGGNLNFVWRVEGQGVSVVVKYAPPYIASDPSTPLDPSRLAMEARCLRALDVGGRLSDVGHPAVRAPFLHDFNPDSNVLIMEDVGAVPTLNRWLRNGPSDDGVRRARRFGHRLGRFIGRLHRTTHHGEDLADEFDNRPMQKTRRAVQYQSVADMLRAGGVEDSDALGARADALGRRLLDRGACLTMGDLWPRSVLVDGNELRLIDWELAHYGRPLQDVAHLLSHLWMEAHRAPSARVEEAVTHLRASFLDAYFSVLNETKTVLWTDREKRDAAIHFGAEILVRAVGPFQEGSVYAGLEPDHPAVQGAVSTAAESLRAPETARVRTVIERAFS